MVTIIFISVTICNVMALVSGFFMIKEQNEFKRSEAEKKAHDHTHAMKTSN